MAPAGIKWRDLWGIGAPIIIPAAVSIATSMAISIAVNQERDNAIERRLTRVESEIEPGMLKVTKAEIESLKIRQERIELRHDQIMTLIFRTGSGYTYLPDGKPK